MSMSNSLKRHIESRKKKMIIDRIINKNAKMPLRDSQIKGVRYFSKIAEIYDHESKVIERVSEIKQRRWSEL